MLHAESAVLPNAAAMFSHQDIAPDFLKRVLSPYHALGADYLRGARRIQVCSTAQRPEDSDKPIVTMQGDFSIPASCYIQSTGHFNAVEFLICFNQLAYATIGHLVTEKILIAPPSNRVSAACVSELEKLSPELFFSSQLSSMFILKTETRFTRVIDPLGFHAKLAVNSLFYLKGTLFADTSCHFADHKGGSAEGTLLLGYPLAAVTQTGGSDE